MWGCHLVSHVPSQKIYRLNARGLEVLGRALSVHFQHPLRVHQADPMILRLASSTGLLLKTTGLKVTAIKIDPYMNIDAGTMAPTEHGQSAHQDTSECPLLSLRDTSQH